MKFTITRKELNKYFWSTGQHLRIKGGPKEFELEGEPVKENPNLSSREVLVDHEGDKIRSAILSFGFSRRCGCGQLYSEHGSGGSGFCTGKFKSDPKGSGGLGIPRDIYKIKYQIKTPDNLRGLRIIKFGMSIKKKHKCDVLSCTGERFKEFNNRTYCEKVERDAKILMSYKPPQYHCEKCRLYKPLQSSRQIVKIKHTWCCGSCDCISNIKDKLNETIRALNKK